MEWPSEAAVIEPVMVILFAENAAFQYRPGQLLDEERHPGCPASAMELPEEVIADWAARAGDRERLREIPLMFATKPDQALLDEWADDAVKASRCALEATLRVLLTPFPQPIANRPQATPVMVLAGKSDALLGPPVQRQIAATYPGSCLVELDCAHEFLIEVPGETAEQVAQFVTALPRGRP